MSAIKGKPKSGWARSNIFAERQYFEAESRKKKLVRRRRRPQLPTPPGHKTRYPDCEYSSGIRHSPDNSRIYR